MQNLISIIIPNHNGKRFLEILLPSIHSQTYKNFEVILVDNNSQDDSIEFIQKRLPSARVIKLRKNYGYAGAANVGIKASNGNIIIVLNNDVELDEYFLEIIHKYFIYFYRKSLKSTIASYSKYSTIICCLLTIT